MFVTVVDVVARFLETSENASTIIVALSQNARWQGGEGINIHYCPKLIATSSNTRRGDLRSSRSHRER